jgi:hypothetical protein
MLVTADSRYRSAFQHNYFIRFNNGRNALRDDKFRTIAKFIPHSLLQPRFGCCIHSAGRIVQYQYLRLFNNALAIAKRCF